MPSNRAEDTSLNRSNDRLGTRKHTVPTKDFRLPIRGRSRTGTVWSKRTTLLAATFPRPLLDCGEDSDFEYETPRI